MDDQPFATRADLQRLAALLVGGGFLRAWPSAWDPFLTELSWRLYKAFNRRRLEGLAERMERSLPAVADRSCHSTSAEHHVRLRIEDSVGRLRGMRRFGWRPELELAGFDHVERALTRGRGVIVWSMRLGSAMALKQGFHQAGYRLHHLSRVEHGSQGRSRLGIRLVAPLYCRAEDPYLAERIQIPAGGSLAYLNRIRLALRANACVSIFGEHEGVQNAEVRVLGVARRFALGAPSLAWAEDATLLTAYVTRTRPFRYRVVVEEPIIVERDRPRKTFAERAVVEFARRLEGAVLRRPADWLRWWQAEPAGTGCEERD